ncbi:MAG: DNA-directed RNA polymerase subunit D [Candidatus Aenigmarchaeota archaeon]|nr:DNA-directed RNA polymerase subunit D [Candidatus Aenigmarchaeota archaeon]
MKIKILNRTDSEIQFLVEKISPAFANALRRIAMTEVPTMAIEWIDFVRNDSALNDEILANRIGLIPLTFDGKAYNLPAECKCGGKGCSRCQVKLKLKKEGPCMIYSGDLETGAKDVKPVFDKIPIVELFEDEKLEFEAIAQLGLGLEHAKWQAAVVGYKNKPVKEIERKDESEETKYIEDAFIFNLESICGLKPEEIVVRAAEILEAKLKDFAKELKKLE